MQTRIGLARISGHEQRQVRKAVEHAQAVAVHMHKRRTSTDHMNRCEAD